MKILNIVIALLVLSIIVTGGFLGYLYYAKNIDTNNNNDNTPTPTDDSNSLVDTNPISDNNTITDSGTDTNCSKLFTQGSNLNGQLADIQFNFTTNYNGDFNPGDKINVNAEVISINPATTWNALALRMIYPCENLKFNKVTPGSDDYLIIPVDSEFNNIAAVEIGATKPNFEMGDKLIEFEFEVVKKGNIILEVADISSIIDEKNQEFSIATNKINL